ncbi:hypothetical protein ACTMTI_46780 [Nonomuraea sp. H19]|uniref:hypothetical protein n=1 Tax=Nonomuraea sp. H19 TaxID=3452206 RepID=UPI003F8B1D1E
MGNAQIGFRPQERERQEATFTDYKTVIIEGAGLCVESDAPEEFVAAIRGQRRSKERDASHLAITVETHPHRSSEEPEIHSGNETAVLYDDTLVGLAVDLVQDAQAPRVAGSRFTRCARTG